MFKSKKRPFSVEITELLEEEQAVRQAFENSIKKVRIRKAAAELYLPHSADGDRALRDLRGAQENFHICLARYERFREKYIEKCKEYNLTNNMLEAHIFVDCIIHVK